ncbi:testis-expressed sequence 264 protein-like [Sinocyclocheilus anshuiensis]|uniref:Testis-expressed sequence 264 protein-like n=1 Tax=Sinocyclocheilus anshuiensis TaxID=1608454 RepID=A0A671QGF7_9TELE|nr:PREDICTED: testis-expressed sequence 264 protein-like [Sinocyclocheilus anshuiensis]
MSDFVILLLILFLVICLILTLVGFVFYTGLFSEVVIRTGSPPVKNITIAYKFRKGSYKASGAAFTESCSVGPKLSSVGVFYDDPNQTQADQCRYVVGSILCENEEKPDKELQRLYEKFGYKVISFPEVTCAVTSSFPNRCTLSPVCGAYRVYPELQQYIKERSLNAYPFLEICKGDLIHYMCPLENQVDFCVPELLQKKTSDDTEETVEHKDADVTELAAGEPEKKSRPVIQEVVEESRDVMEASAPLLESSQPSLGEEEGQSEDGDQGSKGSSESVGSGSSFEELDMEVEEEKEEKKNEVEEEDHNGQQKPMMVGETIRNREE